MPDEPPIPPAPLAEFRFGAIAVWGGFVGSDELDAALAEQAATRAGVAGARRIGEILVARGRLTDEQVHRILRVQLQRLPAEGHAIFGQIAEARRLVSSEHLERALDRQSREILAGGEVRRLGRILHETGYLDEAASEAILAYQATADAAAFGATRPPRPTETLRAASEAAAPRTFLPAGGAGVVWDNIVWIVLGLAAAAALALTSLRGPIFG
jgi:hypothetical protein